MSATRTIYLATAMSLLRNVMTRLDFFAQKLAPAEIGRHANDFAGYNRALQLS
jgi:hypothetical protein